MRLLTHNYLQSNVKGTDKGYPLIIQAEQLVLELSPMDRTLLLGLLPKLDYSAVVQAYHQIFPQLELWATENIQSHPEAAAAAQAILAVDLPASLNDHVDNDLMEKLHRILMDVHIIQGYLICPDTGRKFPVKEGIPNMILHDDEI